MFLSDHTVDVDRSAWQFEAFTDLQWYLRSHAAPDRRLASEAELVAQVGDWVTDNLFGPVAVALAARPGPVRLMVPAGAASGDATAGQDGGAGLLAFLPWELARVGGRKLAAQRVTFVTDLFPDRPVRAKRAVGARLRMLGVFSLPEDAGALNLRRERYALARLVHQIATANNRAVELKVLQYGATRDRLEDALLEEAGWDIVHLSGHGLPDGLLLETDTGKRDLVSSRDLVDLLDATADQLKLITLASCESAAVTANEHLRLLGLRDRDNDSGGAAAPASDAAHAGRDMTGGGTDCSTIGQTSVRPARAGTGTAGLPVVAAALVDRLDCAVLAMRFSVVDDFAIDLTGQFFSMVVGKGQPVARALGLALPRALPAAGGVTTGAPALSVGTPTLFGRRALELKLSAPEGVPLVFDAERIKLAVFPDQPERFVGRVGPMTRASTALAPQSGKIGVLFHGMAGAGKTACALELSYTHQDSFQRLIWYQGPLGETDVAAAFTGLALDLERQIPGLAMVHLVTSPEQLAAFLPTLTQFLEQTRVLLVLDNLEHLLTGDGQWRDPRWEQFVTAVTSHTGGSRVVMTSRTRPQISATGLVVEPVHALSLAESVLLAREWPHLRALLDTATPDAGSGTRALSGSEASALLARTLTVLQGHPKLIELADGQAADPTTLAARLDEADRAWLTTGTRLETFLHTGEPTATDTDYLTVLAGWTRATTADLPEPAAALLTLLACLQEDDRTPSVLEDVWPVVWSALGQSGETPPLEQALAPLLEQALVNIDTTTSHTSAGDATPTFTGGGGGEGAAEDRPITYRVHPGVAEAVRAATPPDATAALEELAADFWQVVLARFLKLAQVLEVARAAHGEGEGLGRMVLTTARSAMPYLSRRHRWGDLDNVAQQVLGRDRSPQTAAALLPLLRAAADATKGTDAELSLGRTHARLLALMRPAEAQPLLRTLLETAATREDHGMASAIAGDLVILYRDAGHLEEALALVETKKEHTRRAGYGPWSQLLDEGMRLMLLQALGGSEEVFKEVSRLRTRMVELPPEGDPDGAVFPFGVRENLLSIGRSAAANLGRWQDALNLNAEKLASLRSRGAPELEIVSSAVNDYQALLWLGRFTQARNLLLWCREVADANNDMAVLGITIAALSQVEDQLGHLDAAVRLATDALRLSYAIQDPSAVADSHNILAGYLEDTGEPIALPWAHLLAGAIIMYQAGDGSLDQHLRALAQLMSGADPETVPATFADVCQIVDQVPGVHLADLLGRLPARAADPDTAMGEVLAAARALPPDQGAADYLSRWRPVVSAVVASTGGNPDAATVMDAALDSWAESPYWRPLTAALRLVAAGNRDADTLTGDLDEAEAAILTRTLAALDGTQPVDPDAWRTLTHLGALGEGEGANEIEVALGVGLAAAAALGDTDAAAKLTPMLDLMTEDPHQAPLSSAVRRVLAGERDVGPLTLELDESSAAVVVAVLDQIATASETLSSGTDATCTDEND
ncbi:hypothetical protein AB4Y83_12040 [Terrabacter sp. RAF57]